MAVMAFFTCFTASLKDDGTVNDEGNILFYEPGTEIGKNVYSTSELDVSLGSNPTLNSTGRKTIFLNGDYDCVIRDSDDNTIVTIPNINPSSSGSVTAVAANTALTSLHDGTTIEVTGTTTLTVDSVETLSEGWSVWIENVGSGVVTIARQASGDTINGTAANITIQPNIGLRLIVNAAATGLFTIAESTGVGSDSSTGVKTFASNLPAGVIMQYGGSSAPTGWLLCDGTAYSRTTYAALFAIVSTTFGTGDGSTTFNVPDFCSRVPVGVGTGTLAESVGFASVNTTNDTFDVTSNADTWVTGMAVVLTTTGGLPTGLSLSTTYYVIRGSATTIQFATTLANAIAGTAIDLTTQGTGTHTATHTLTARTRGTKLGKETHGLTLAELPSHGGHVTSSNTDGTAGASDTNATGNVALGSSTAHSIMNPALVVNYIIKT